MQCHFFSNGSRTMLLNGPYHFCDAKSPDIFANILCQLRHRKRFPVSMIISAHAGSKLLLFSIYLRHTSMMIGIRNHQGSLRSIHFKQRKRRFPDIEAEVHIDTNTVFHLHQNCIIGRHLYVHNLPFSRPVVDFSLIKALSLKGNQPLYRSEHTHQNSKIVGSHIIDRSASFRIERLRRRVPGFHTGSHHIGCDIQRFSNPPILQQLPAGCHRTAKKCIRSASSIKSPGLRKGKNFLRFLYAQSKRLLTEDMLAGIQNLAIDFRMKLRRRQIDHQLNVFPLQKLIHAAAGRNLKFLRQFLRLVHRSICHCLDRNKVRIQALQISYINPADHTTANDSKLHWIPPSKIS